MERKQSFSRIIRRKSSLIFSNPVKAELEKKFLSFTNGKPYVEARTLPYLLKSIFSFIVALCDLTLTPEREAEFLEVYSLNYTDTVDFNKFYDLSYMLDKEKGELKANNEEKEYSKF